MSLRKSYVVAQAQIVGSPSNWHLLVSSDNAHCRTRKEAISHGLSKFGHDDFWIATVQDGKLVDLRWMDESRERDEDEWNAVADALGIEKALS